jgi:protein-S-isoprenylcysteine O-methyltransferase Ste14
MSGMPQKGLVHRAATAYGNYLFRYRNAVFPLATIALAIAFRPAHPGAGADIVLDIAGIAIVALGQTLRAAVIGLAYIKRGGVNKRIHADTLVTEGLFAHCRNPLYVGNLMILLGVMVVFNNPWVYVVGGAFFTLSYAAIVLAEESFLSAKFAGAYEAYCRDVPRWWIDPRGLAATFRDMRFNWKRMILKDYATIATSTLMVLAALAYRNFIAQGATASWTQAVECGAAVLAIVAAVLVVRALKKARILVDRLAEPPPRGKRAGQTAA